MSFPSRCGQGSGKTDCTVRGRWGIKSPLELEVPKTIPELVMELMPTVLKESTEAKGLALQLKGHDISTEMALRPNVRPSSLD